MSSQPQRGGNRNLDSYVGVHTRVELFRQAHPNGRILTQIVPEREPLTVRAEVYFEDNATDIPNGVGHADEGGGMGNRGRSALEMTETAAVGRALAFCGYEVKEGIASREEVERAAPPLRTVPPPAPLEQPSVERRELLEQVTARSVELGYDTAKQLAARAKAAKMTDADIRSKVIPSLDKLIDERRREETRLRTVIYRELNQLYKTAEAIDEYLAQNEGYHGGRLLEEMHLEQLQRVASGLEIKS